MAAHFEIICIIVLGLACKGAAILEINKRTMKTDNIRKLVQTNYVMYIKTGIVRGRSQIFFFFCVCVCAKTITVGAFFDGREIGNMKFF